MWEMVPRQDNNNKQDRSNSMHAHDCGGGRGKDRGYFVRFNSNSHAKRVEKETRAAKKRTFGSTELES